MEVDQHHHVHSALVYDLFDGLPPENRKDNHDILPQPQIIMDSETPPDKHVADNVQPKQKHRMRIKIGAKDSRRVTLKGIHTISDLWIGSDVRLANDERSSFFPRYFVVTYPNYFTHPFARNSAGMVSLLRPLDEMNVSSFPELATLRNTNLFEAFLMRSQKKIRLSAQWTDKKAEVVADHFISSQPVISLRTAPSHLSSHVRQTLADWNTHKVRPAKLNFERKYDPETVLIARAIEAERLHFEQAWKLHPSYVSALLNIAKRYIPDRSQKTGKNALKRVAVLPPTLNRIVRYLSYCVFVAISPDYKRYESFFPYFVSCDRLLSLEEFVGWYLPLCWESTRPLDAGGSADSIAIRATSPVEALRTDERISVQRRLQEIFGRCGKQVQKEPFDFVYYQAKSRSLLKELFSHHVRFQHPSDFYRYFNTLQSTIQTKGYVRITNKTTKEVVGYVVHEPLVRSFASWKKEAADRCCQRCGDKHMTIDCPWLFFPPAVVYDRTVHEDIISTASAYCNESIAERLKELPSHPDQHVRTAVSLNRQPEENLRKNVIHSVVEPKQPRKRGRRRKEKNPQTVAPLHEKPRSSLEKTEPLHPYKCTHCQVFTTQSYAALFRHMNADCPRKHS